MKTVGYFMFLILFCLSVAAQTSPTESQTEKEKARKETENRVLEILDQVVSDAATLKLPQNRAVVFAIAGDLYWKFDEKRARELFRNCESEMLTANFETDKDKKESDNFYDGIFDFGADYRSDVLPLIAKHDADLALEMLVKTRTAKLAAAIAKTAQPAAKQDSSFFAFNPEDWLVKQEIALEQRFAVLAAEQSPDKAIKLLKDSLAKGISWNVMPLLQKINKKDEKKAVSLADDLIKKLVETDLTKRNDDLNAAVQFLLYATNPNQPKNPKEKLFKFSDTQVKDIANKLAATFLTPSKAIQTMMAMNRAMPGLEKVIPEKIAIIKQAQAETMKNMPLELKNLQRQENFWNPNSTPEEIVAELPKLNELEKASAYQSLISKIGQIDDESRVKKLIEQIPDEKARNQINERYESEKIDRASQDGKLDEAKKLIKNLSQKKTQIQKLVAIALEFKRKNTEKDTETALGLMKDAKALANEFPEDENELNDLMEIVKGYATIDPPEAFRIFEPIVDQLNDFVQATAILSKYNKRSRTFIKGELVMRVNGSSWDNILIFRYAGQMKLLGKADLNKMSSFADKFQRTDARIIVKLFLAQGFFKEDKKENEDEDRNGDFVILDY